MSNEERNALVNERVALEEVRLGLDRPFVARSFAFLKDAMTLNLGMAEQILSDSGSRTVRLIMLERLPATLILFGSANLLLFFSSVFIALFLSRRYGSYLDKVIDTLAPTGSAPSWFYGIFLILIFFLGSPITPIWWNRFSAPTGEHFGLCFQFAQTFGLASHCDLNQRNFSEYL